jgi:antitoxin (DNA-binding transcriptional repressor) of toxin-antitoxin stability system
MVTLDAEQANEAFAQAIERAAAGKERVLIQREGRTVAVLVPVDELEGLELKASQGVSVAEPASEPFGDSTGTTVGERLLAMVEELRRDVPDEEWEKLPTDLAEQHDHYIYGTPKRPR